MTAKRFIVDLGWPLIFETLGIDGVDVLRHAGLPADLFAQPNPTLSTKEYFALWRGLETVAGDPAFPLRIGRSVSAEAFSPPLMAAYCSPDLATALARLSQYKPLIGPMRLEIRKTDVGVSATYRSNQGLLLPPGLALAELVFLVHMARSATKLDLRPASVCVAELPKAPDAYEAYFGTALCAERSNTVEFTSADAMRPFLTVNSALFGMFEPALAKRLADLGQDESFADRVRAALLEALPSGRTSIGAVARILAVSPRTLQRRLGQENESFQDLLAAMRRDLACDYLRKTALSNAEISFLLGYEDPNSFIRAFHGWTGTSPMALRSSTSMSQREASG